MGATLSKLWGSFKSAFTGGGAPAKSNHNDNKDQAKDVEDRLPKTNTPAKPPTPLPDMGGIQKYEITEVRFGAFSKLKRGSFDPAEIIARPFSATTISSTNEPRLPVE